MRGREWRLLPYLTARRLQLPRKHASIAFGPPTQLNQDSKPWPGLIVWGVDSESPSNACLPVPLPTSSKLASVHPRALFAKREARREATPAPGGVCCVRTEVLSSRPEPSDHKAQR